MPFITLAVNKVFSRPWIVFSSTNTISYYLLSVTIRLIIIIYDYYIPNAHTKYNLVKYKLLKIIFCVGIWGVVNID
jgi:hypothetical protein